MKRFICLLFALSFISVISYAENIDFVGVWVSNRETSDGDTIINYFHLFEDNTAYYSAEKYNTSSKYHESSFHFCTWQYNGEELIFTFTNENNTVLSYYVVNESCFALDKNGKYNPFAKVNYSFKSPKETQEADRDPVGMWSFYWDAQSLNKQLGSKRMSFDINAINLYLFSNGSAYMTNCSVVDGDPDFSRGALDGLWIGNAEDMTIRVGEQTYKAWIDDDGRLFLKMTDSMAFIYTKIKNYDYKEGTL